MTDLQYGVKGEALRTLRELTITHTWRLAGIELWYKGGSFQNWPLSFVGGLISHQDHGKAVCFARGYCLCSTDMLSGRLQGTARGGHYVPAGPKRIPGEHVLVMCFACPNWGQDKSVLGPVGMCWALPSVVCLSRGAPAGFPPAARPLDLQALGSHCPPMLETLMVQDSYLALAGTYCAVTHSIQ